MDRIIIAAMSTDRVIGRDDGMPWDIPEEYAHFLDTVRGQTLIMGRRSYKIFKKDLTSDHTIVVTRSPMLPGVNVAGSLAAALAKAAELGKTVFIAGGGTIYTQALVDDVVDHMYLSTIKGDFTGDTYFPEWDADDWEIETTEDRGPYIYTHYRRTR